MSLLFGAAFALLSPAAPGQTTYPARAVTFVVPFAAGGATDVLARQFAERMARTFGQGMVIENVAGVIASHAVTMSGLSRPQYVESWCHDTNDGVRASFRKKLLVQHRRSGP